MFKLNVFLLLWMLECTSLAQTKGPERPELHFEISIKPESEVGTHLIKAMTQVLDRLGYDFRYTEYPAKRGLIELKEGRIDGSMGRIGNLAELLQNSRVKRIDHPAAVFDFSRWCLKETRPDQPRIRTGTRLGALAMMMLEPEMSIPPVELQEIKDHRSGLKMLKSKRLDCIITAEKGFETEGISADDLKEFVRADLITFQVFPWILDRHESLRQAIADGLKNYPFTADFRRKYQSANRVCENSLNRLCPDGLLFRKKVFFTVGP